MYFRRFVLFTHSHLALKKKPKVFGVPSFDDFYMAMCFLNSSRSKDPDMQHGAVIVDAKKRIISIGYNGTPAGIGDLEIDWSKLTKSFFVVSADENAIDNCQTPWRLDNAVIYLSGPPTASSVKRIINNKIRKIIYGPLLNKFHDKRDWEMSVELANLSKVILEKYPGNLNWIKDWIGMLNAVRPEIFEQPLPAI